MKERIQALMESKKMSQKMFAQETGINEGTLSLLLRDKANPTLKIYEAIHTRFPDVSMEWLFDGTGSMYKKGDAEASASQGAVAATSNGTSSLFPNDPSSPSAATPSGQATVQGASSSLFAPSPQGNNQGQNSGDNPQPSVIKYIDKPQRKITEIRVFFDDQTWESFVPKK